MKEKIYFLSLFYSILIIILTIITILNMKSTVNISRNETIEERLIALKNEINSLEESECKDFIVDFANHIEKGNFDGETKIKDLYDYYWNNIDLIFFNKGRESCKNIDLTNSQITSKYLIGLRTPDLLFQDLFFSYELRLKDPLREYVESQTTNVNITAIRFNQLNLLEDYINEYKKGESYEN